MVQMSTYPWFERSWLKKDLLSSLSIVDIPLLGVKPTFNLSSLKQSSVGLGGTIDGLIIYK